MIKKVSESTWRRAEEDLAARDVNPAYEATIGEIHALHWTYVDQHLVSQTVKIGKKTTYFIDTEYFGYE